MSHPMQKVNLPTELPVRNEAEVMVVGGGPGGIGAAVAAAREGADVLLVEHYGFLGGMATAGEVNPFMPNHLDSRSLDEGVYTDWLDRIESYGGRRRGTLVFNPNVARLAAEDLCLEAGVRLLYHHRTAQVETAERRITCVVLHTKSGLSAARAGQYIDGTGDGDLCAAAGCAFEYGGEGTEYVQPMTLCFKLKLDRADAPPGRGREDLYTLVREQNNRIQQAFRRAQEDGRIHCPRENVLMFRGVDGDVVHFNTTRVIKKSSINGAELSEAEIEARRQLRELVAVLRSDVPIFRNARVYSIAPQIGIRESRRILGRYYLTRKDYEDCAAFPDGVARVNYPIDIHSPTGSGTEIVRLPKGGWYEVPFGCLLPRDVDNLAIGSRCISVDHAVHASCRVMAPVCSLGHAAGTAAAMAIQQGVDVCRVDGRELKQRLIRAGRNLVPYDPDRKFAMTEKEQARHRTVAAHHAKTYSA